MPTYKITGGTPLKGTIRIGGSKNAVLPLLASTLLVKEPCKFTNVPDISDVDVMLDILQGIGATVDRNRQERTVVVDTTNAEFFDITGEGKNGKDLQALSGKIRAKPAIDGADAFLIIDRPSVLVITLLNSKEEFIAQRFHLFVQRFGDAE